MATKLESEYASSPTNDDSDGDGQDSADAIYQEEIKPPTNNVADILKRLQSSGALIKKPKIEHRCYTCDEDFRNWEELENHLIQHVSLPSVVLERLPSDDEDIPSEDENWSEEEESPPPVKVPPQKIDISQILKKTGISIKKSNPEPDKSSNSALNKLSGLGFTIKKNSSPIKKEPDAEPVKSDVMQKLGNLGGIKLKLKSSGNNTNSFKVVNGLKDFKASDDEDEGSGNEEEPDGNEEDHKSSDQDGSAPDNDSADEQPDNRKNSESNDSDKSSSVKIPNIGTPLKSLQGKTIAKVEPMKIALKTASQPVIKEMPPLKPSGRPAIKQTPKRGANLPIPPREIPTPTKELTSTTPPTPDRIQTQNVMENVTVKKEVDVGEQSSSIPLFSTQIKSERTSPPPLVPFGDGKSTPMLATVKSEPDASSLQSPQPLFSNNRSTPAPNSASSEGSIPGTPLFSVAKMEDNSATVIEINGDSNDEDDDCCVVSATPAPDVKPVVPKTENPQPAFAPPAFSTSQSGYGTSSVLSSRLSAPSSLEKQHNFNWNAPDSKPPIDMLEKSADDIFESLLSNSAKKENLSISEASEYISLDTLGPQHSCDICNTRFTDLSLLEDHKRMTGHSRSLVAPSSSTLLPYNPTSNILSSLLPVKQLADQVGKLSTIGGSGPGFTHQQNVMINIQAYPGAGGVMGPPPPYNAYPSGQNMNSGYQGQNNMYGPSGGNQMPGQYPGQHYMGPQGYGQFPTSMPSSTYPGTTPQFSAPPSQYSTSSPLQSMQQSVYGQSPAGMPNMQGQMGPPVGAPYVPSSSPGGTMKSPNNSGVRIQNVQTFPPGQLVGMPGQPVPVSSDLSSQPSAPGQMIGGQMPPPNQIRMAAGAMGPRPRMPGIRGQRPSIRPGIQVHGQVRGAKPGMRMPMKRPANIPMGANNAKKRPSMLLPDKHDNEDCTVMAMQKQREGLPMIHSVQGAKDKINLGSQISITKKTVNKEASAMANVLASRGISIKQKQKSRSPTPERPLPHIPNLGAGVSIKHTSKSSNFSIPEAKVGGGMLSCKICKKMFMNQNSLTVHMTNAHPQSKVPLFKCDECPASYPKSLQLQHHKRVFHNVTGPNRELGLPVVDLAQEDNLKRLSNLGIYSFIPLANRELAGGCFGIPVISVHNMHNGMTSSLQALGADGLLSLGPLKPLPKP
ncbi:hypothetical protein O3G_MSEX010512 [Manduca sexta]|uniref:C2H2-type domain-containing protein n=1 Tax=Manduca sexta TaxID=7130 RepID=A0A921ZHE2_MANSE|nr:hypothetical protein O3G_MSEX010512 [Manduca sexta]